jgi:hypothetical protein
MKKIKNFIPYLVLLMMIGTIGDCASHKDEKEVTRKTTTTTERPVVEEKKTTTTTTERPVLEQKKTTTTIERD